jgi:hypothetical protein
LLQRFSGVDERGLHMERRHDDFRGVHSSEEVLARFGYVGIDSPFVPSGFERAVFLGRLRAVGSYNVLQRESRQSGRQKLKVVFLLVLSHTLFPFIPAFRLEEFFMILTVTLNPAVDSTLYVDNFTKDGVNRVLRETKQACGKGINVSRMLRSLSEDTAALAIVGGSPGEFMESELTREGLAHHFVVTDSETRTNIKIVDTAKSQCTDVNRNGLPVWGEVFLELRKCIKERVKEGDFLVLSGSAPINAPPDVYKDIIEENPGVKAALDASGALLKSGVAAKPFLEKKMLTGRLPTLTG